MDAGSCNTPAIICTKHWEVVQCDPVASRSLEINRSFCENKMFMSVDFMAFPFLYSPWCECCCIFILGGCHKASLCMPCIMKWRLCGHTITVKPLQQSIYAAMKYILIPTANATISWKIFLVQYALKYSAINKPIYAMIKVPFLLLCTIALLAVLSLEVLGEEKHIWNPDLSMDIACYRIAT